METKKRSTSQIIEQHVKKWEYEKSISKEKKEVPVPVVTISREPGSGGRIIAEKLAEKLEFDLFQQEVVHDMAKDADISVRFLEILDERALTTLDNWIASLVDKRYLWPDKYLHHLMKVIAAIGKHGASVIVGRGANFILPPEIRISIRIIAPFEFRCRHVADEFGLSMDEAGRRITKTESTRRSFIRKYFNTSIADTNNYDMLINTGFMSIDEVVHIMAELVKKRMN